MRNKTGNIRLQKLAISIGDFIRYWGFRRVHGAIWAQLYLSKEPLSCSALTAKLDFSKALISPALEELVQYKLIQEVPSPNDKTKLYRATENINEVIQHVLKTREALMLKQITTDFSNLSDAAPADETIDPSRLKALGEMIQAANLMLTAMIGQTDIFKLPAELDL